MARIETFPCAGKDCTNEGTNRLKLRYLDLIGNFCQSCTDSLINEGLAVVEEK